MQKITPCLWFDTNAEDAANFYVSVFRNSKILNVSHYTENMPMPAGTVLLVSFSLNGQDFAALNAGPAVKFNEAVSFMVNCDTQEEVDYYWNKLAAGGGQTGQCGWLKDKFGVSWQVAPAIVGKLVSDPDPVKAGRVLQAIMKMNKIDLQALQRAHGQG